MDARKVFTTNDAATAFGLSADELSVFENKGLLAPTTNEDGARIYSAEDQATMVLIARGKRLRFSVSETTELIALSRRMHKVLRPASAGPHPFPNTAVDEPPQHPA